MIVRRRKHPAATSFHNFLQGKKLEDAVGECYGTLKNVKLPSANWFLDIGSRKPSDNTRLEAVSACSSGKINFRNRRRFMFFLNRTLASDLCQFRIQFCAHEHRKTSPVQPCH